MQRLLRIVLLITFMLLIILWFSTIFNTCNKKDEVTATEQMTEGSDSSDVFQDLDDEFFEDEQDLFTEESGGSTNLETQASRNNNNASDPFQYEDPDDFTDYTGEPATNTENSGSSKSNTKSSSYNENATYLVVAGSFLVKDNADNMRQKLQNLGYSAEVRNFNYSQYHSVIAGRYNSKSDADNTVAQLKNRGISCYVHKRQP
jgi:cell division protein FtsN